MLAIGYVDAVRFGGINIEMHDLWAIKGVPGRIVVVEDNPMAAKLTKAILTAEGYQVNCCNDTVSAKELIRRELPDLILLDVMLPDQDGLQFCRHLKDDQRTRGIPVLLLTALESVKDKVAGLDAGAEDYLCKPFDHLELLARVRSLMRTKRMRDEMESMENIFIVLARVIDARDAYTRGHSERVAEVSAYIARKVGMDDNTVTAITKGAFLHDIGKVGLSEVIRKPAELSPDEYNVVQQHPVIGEKIMAPLPAARNLLCFIRSHHEKLDGSGYPDGLKGNAIPLGVRVLSVADVFDALTSNRPYRKSMSIEQAITLLWDEVKKGWWDPEVVQALESVILENIVAKQNI